MSENLKLYEAVRSAPPKAQKTIKGGRLKGMTDINPMWRIKCLTEQFGVCGVGWYYEITDKWLENSMASDEISANVTINLYIKQDGEWSRPIQGVGGSMFVSQEKNGIYTNDECYKMALTDAISVACKALGVGADIYWGSDNTKYNDSKKEDPENLKERIKEREAWKHKVLTLAQSKGISAQELAKDYGLDKNTTADRFKEILKDLEGGENEEFKQQKS